MTTTIFVDPSIAGADMLFSTGTVANGAEQFQAVLPDLGGSADTGWNVTQWNTPADQIFEAGDPMLADPADADPLLGAALASWHTGTAANGSALVVYGQPGNNTYRLGATGGSTRDTFLQTTGYASGTVTFDHQLSFSADERVVSADAGDGTAIAFNAFTVFFNASDNPSYNRSLPTLELFLQIPLTDFRGQPGPYQTIAKGDYYQKIYNLSSQSWSATAGTLVSDASVNALSFAADTGALHTVDIDLNQALLRMVDVMASQDPDNAAAYLDLSRWSVGSTYLGVETNAGTTTGSGALAIDVAHPTLTDDLSVAVSASTALSTVQSIDNNRYANVDTSNVITTLPGTTNTITLDGTLGQKTVTSQGTDTITVGNNQTVAFHAQGVRLSIVGDVTSFATVTIDGTAPITTSGRLDTLTIDSSGDNDLITGSASGTAQLTLRGSNARISLAGTVDATLSGADARLAANGGVVSLYGNGSQVDLDGNGAQTIFLNGQTAGVTETGTGAQTIVGAPSLAGSLLLSGGNGAQTLWTGGTSSIVTASDCTNAGAVLAVHAQAGSNTHVQLGAERLEIDGQGGTLTVDGSTNDGGLATIYGGHAAITVWGGAEQLIASAGDMADGRLQVQGGSGTQTIFGGRAMLDVLGSHDTNGSQTIVNGNDAGEATTIFGGRSQQTIWTGQANDTIVSSTAAGDASGSIQAFIQGGASAYWGGTETASLDNQNGILDAFLAGDGQVSILADLSNGTTTTLQGFNSLHDTLTLAGVADPAALRVSTSNGNTVLSVQGGPGTVTLLGLSHVDLSFGVAGVTVMG